MRYPNTPSLVPKQKNPSASSECGILVIRPLDLDLMHHRRRCEDLPTGVFSEFIFMPCSLHHSTARPGCGVSYGLTHFSRFRKQAQMNREWVDTELSDGSPRPAKSRNVLLIDKSQCGEAFHKET